MSKTVRMVATLRKMVRIAKYLPGQILQAETVQKASVSDCGEIGAQRLNNSYLLPDPNILSSGSLT